MTVLTTAGARVRFPAGVYKISAVLHCGTRMLANRPRQTDKSAPDLARMPSWRPDLSNSRRPGAWFSDTPAVSWFSLTGAHKKTALAVANAAQISGSPSTRTTPCRQPPITLPQRGRGEPPSPRRRILGPPALWHGPRQICPDSLRETCGHGRDPAPACSCRS